MILEVLDFMVKFLIDSNSFISAYRNFYACDIVAAYWKKLSEHIQTKEIVLLDMVKSELENGNDSLPEWVNNQNFEICSHISPRVINNYSNVMNYIQTCGFYNDKGLASWARNEVADPWLVAAAMEYGYIIVTFERGDRNLTTRNKVGKVKIPDVASHFNVICIDLYDMMRRLKMNIQ